MKILGLDMSSRTGWALLEGSTLLRYGQIKVEIADFNVNNFPNLSSKYPRNILEAANKMAELILELYLREKPDIIVVEQLVKGRNRHTQRILDWIHKSFWDKFIDLDVKIVYMDPSEWRKILEIKLNKEDKENNKLVSKGLKRGRINKKHLALRLVNAAFNLSLKVKDNDMADAIGLCMAYIRKNQ